MAGVGVKVGKGPAVDSGVGLTAEVIARQPVISKPMSSVAMSQVKVRCMILSFVYAFAAFSETTSAPFRGTGRDKLCSLAADNWQIDIAWLQASRCMVGPKANIPSLIIIDKHK